MALNENQAVATLCELENTLSYRTADIEKWQRYYDGKHNLNYASEEYREWFSEQFEDFADNWCAPVADATVERMKIEGVRPYGADKVDKELQQQWERCSGTSESKLGFSTAAITGRAFALVWGSKNGPELTFEHPSQCIVQYETGSRRKRTAALKLWRDYEAQMVYATLYTPDNVWKFQKSTPVYDQRIIVPDTFRAQGGTWKQREGLNEQWPLTNPMGVVPMVELQNRPKLRGEPLNEISGVAAMQDAVNALWSYLFTAADFAALPQRVILGAQLPKMPVLNENGVKVGEKPIDLPEANVKRILNLEGPDAKIGQWDAANLSIFTDVIEKAVGHIASQTRTPIYYFASSIQNISGDSLQALDSGLCAKIVDRQIFYDDPILEIYSLMALAMGERQKAKSLQGGTVMWADHESRTETQRMDKLLKMQTIGFPFQYIVEQFTGGDAEEVQRIMDMRKSEAENDPLSLLGQRMQGIQDQAEGQGPEQAARDASKKGATGGSDNGGSDGTGRQAA